MRLIGVTSSVHVPSSEQIQDTALKAKSNALTFSGDQGCTHNQLLPGYVGLGRMNFIGILHFT